MKDQNSFEPESVVKGYYARETPRAVFIKLPDQKFICVPKSTINSVYAKDTNTLQEFIIDDWVLRKLGLLL